MTPDEYCQQKTAASGSSFYQGFRYLPPDQRRAITAVYAFCREVDDVVDDCHDPQVAAAKLDWWRAEITGLPDKTGNHPVTQALASASQAFSLPLEQFEEILDGMEMDLTQARYPDFKALNLYCHRVAGVVGQLSARIFGYQDRQTLKYAHELGVALQLTNIIRDVGEDARRGRIYIPVEDLERFGVPARDILAGQSSEAFLQLMAFQAERAEQHYERAMALLPDGDRKAQRPGLIMAAIYHTLLDEIRKDGYRVLEYRIALPMARKLWIAWKTWLTG